MRQQITLGGKLSIGVAAVWAASFGILVLESQAGPPHRLAEYGACVIMVLSFPLAALTGAVSTMGPISTGVWIKYLLLMVPNCLIFGYSLAGCWHVAMSIIRPSAVDCAVREFPTTSQSNKIVEQGGDGDA